MDEFESAEQIGRDRKLAPALGAALQGPDPDRGGLEETPAFIGGEVLAAAGTDKLEIADQAIHFAQRNFRLGPSAKPRPRLSKLRIPCERALQGVRGGSKMRHYVDSVSGGWECGASARACG